MGSLLNLYLICVSGRVLHQVNTSLTEIIKTKTPDPSISSQTSPHSQTQNPRNEGEARSPWGRTMIHCQHLLLFTFLPASPRDLWSFNRVTVHWKKKSHFWGLLGTASELVLISKDWKCNCDLPVRFEAYRDQMVNGILAQVHFAVGSWIAMDWSFVSSQNLYVET